MTVPHIGDHVISGPLEHAPATNGTSAYSFDLHAGPRAVVDGPARAQEWRGGFNTSATAGEPVDVSGFCGGSAFEY
jgi:hypothetical protein